MSRARLGADGEEAAACFLAARGYVVLARNFRVREGEIDLIARRDRVLAFVEVKTRRGRAFGPPAEAVTRRKQARIRGLARRYLADTESHADIVRFDVVEVEPDGAGFLVNHIEAAF
jgi:putative endonuclease